MERSRHDEYCSKEYHHGVTGKPFQLFFAAIGIGPIHRDHERGQQSGHGKRHEDVIGFVNARPPAILRSGPRAQVAKIARSRDSNEHIIESTDCFFDTLRDGISNEIHESADEFVRARDAPTGIRHTTFITTAATTAVIVTPSGPILSDETEIQASNLFGVLKQLLSRISRIFGANFLNDYRCLR